MVQARRRGDNRCNLEQRRNRLRRQLQDMDLRQRNLAEKMKIAGDELRQIEEELEEEVDE